MSSEDHSFESLNPIYDEFEEFDWDYESQSMPVEMQNQSTNNNQTEQVQYPIPVDAETHNLTKLETIESQRAAFNYFTNSSYYSPERESFAHYCEPLLVAIDNIHNSLLNIPFVQVEIPKFGNLINEFEDYVIFPFGPVDWAKIISCKGKLRVLCVVPDIPLCDRMCQWIPFVLPIVAQHIHYHYNNIPEVQNCAWYNIIIGYTQNAIPWGEHVDGIFIQPIIQNRMNPNEPPKNTITVPPLIRNLNNTHLGNTLELIQIHQKMFDLGQLPPVVREKRLSPIIN